MSYRLISLTLSNTQLETVVEFYKKEQNINLTVEKLTDMQIEDVLLLAFREFGNSIF